MVRVTAALAGVALVVILTGCSSAGSDTGSAESPSPTTSSSADVVPIESLGPLPTVESDATGGMLPVGEDYMGLPSTVGDHQLLTYDTPGSTCEDNPLASWEDLIQGGDQSGSAVYLDQQGANRIAGTTYCEYMSAVSLNGEQTFGIVSVLFAAVPPEEIPADAVDKVQCVRSDEILVYCVLQAANGHVFSATAAQEGDGSAQVEYLSSFLRTLMAENKLAEWNPLLG